MKSDEHIFQMHILFFDSSVFFYFVRSKPSHSKGGGSF